MTKPNKQNTDWEKEFDKKFTRKSKGLEDKGKYMDRWFVRETTSEELKDFISQLLLTQRQELIEEIEEIVGEDEKENILNVLGTRHIDGLMNESRNKLRQQIRERLKLLI